MKDANQSCSFLVTSSRHSIFFNSYQQQFQDFLKILNIYTSDFLSTESDVFYLERSTGDRAHPDTTLWKF